MKVAAFSTYLYKLSVLKNEYYSLKPAMLSMWAFFLLLEEQVYIKRLYHYSL